MGLPIPVPDVMAGESALATLEAAATDPTRFLAPNIELATAARLAAKALYALATPLRPASGSNLPELHVAGFDPEQIWLQLELATNPVVTVVKKRLKKSIKRVETDGAEAFLQIPEANEQAQGDEQAQGSEDAEDPGDEADEDDIESDGTEPVEAEDDDWQEDERRASSAQAEASGRAVEDRFLRLEEMEKFLDDAEAAAAREDDEDEGEDEEEGDAGANEGDLDDDGIDEDASDVELQRALNGATKKDDGQARYEDFWGGSKQRKVRGKDAKREREEDWEADGAEDWEGSEEEDEEEGSPREKGAGAAQNGLLNNKDPAEMSSHEARMARIAEKAAALERANLEGKDWTMTGEVTAGKRPPNSALEVDLDFEHAARPPPIITQEVTESLEDLIKKRIAEMKFDDVQRKAPPPSEAPKQRLELDEKKSDRGLGEIYEEEYVKATAAPGTLSATTEADVVKAEASALFKALCSKLDCLSHFHFAPKPIVEDMSVKADVPALAMEEVAPVAVSDAALLAPEEVYAGGDAVVGKKAAGAVKAEAELTQQDRKRRRARKKRVKKVESDGHKRARLAAQGMSLADSVALAKAAKGTQLAEPGKAPKAYTKSAQVFAGIQEAREQASAQKGSQKLGQVDKKTEKRVSFKL